MKTYLGDGVYFEFKDYEVILTTENGFQTTNRIVLGPEQIISLMRALDKISTQFQSLKDRQS